MNEYNNNDINNVNPDGFTSQRIESAETQRAYGGEYTYVPPKAKKERKKGGAGRVVALVLCCSLLGGVLGAGGATLGVKSYYAKNAQQSDSKDAVTIYKSDREPSAVNTVSVSTGEMYTASQIYEANVNSTVGITTEITTNYFGYQSTSAASGSGFIISEDGYIVTNYHVIEDANSVSVSTYDGNKYDAEIVGYNESNDIAVLKIDVKGLTPVTIGSSDDLKVGDGVIAIGNPLGELSFSLTQGVVSALDRDITISSGVRMKLIQTDCAINSGNSGGALFNMYGEVVGITNAKYSNRSSSSTSIDNIGFAIPIDEVMSMIDSIIKLGYVPQPYIGVSVTSVDANTSALGVPDGAIVKAVNEDSPAENAGIQVNDLITAVNGNVISSSDDLVSYVSSKSIGDKLTLEIYRKGETVTVELTIGEKPQNTNSNSETASQQQDSNQGSQYYGNDPFSQFFGEYFSQQGGQNNYGYGNG